MVKRVYIALGSNVGDRVNYLRRALVALSDHSLIRLSAVSSIYETRPVGFLKQRDFLNMVVQIETSLEPGALLAVTQQIEQLMHRQRKIHQGPRTLDLDILLYEDMMMTTKSLTVPHPRMTERAFVLVPLDELAPDLVVPGTGTTVSRLLEQVEGKEGVQLCLTTSLAAEFGHIGN